MFSVVVFFLLGTLVVALWASGCPSINKTSDSDSEVFHHIHTTYCTLVMSGLLELKKKIKKVALGVEQTHGWLFRDFPHILCTWSFREIQCRRHYSSWEVSRESQSSPLRFFVESIATDHQEVSSFFFMEKIRPLEDSNPRPGA